jgi:serine protease
MRRPILFLIALSLAVFGVIPAASGQEDGPIARDASFAPHAPAFVLGELLVRYDPQVAPVTRTALADRAGASASRPLALEGASLVHVPAGQESEVAQELREQPGVLSVEPNAVRYASLIPNDPIYEDQWHLDQIGMPDAWDLSSASGVTVAVLDTGVAFEDCNVATCGATYTQAPDFGGTTFVDPFDAINDDAHPNDVHGHGTFVASTIAQATNNAIANAGIAFDADIMPVQVLGSSGTGSVASLIDGIGWAKDHGADIINMSLGASGALAIEQAAVDAAVAEGIVVIAAAGNNNASTLECPACYPSAIAAGATRFDETRSYYSNYGTGVQGHTLDLVAPGGDVTVDQNGDTYADGTIAQSFLHFCDGPPINPNVYAICIAQGTSMATPHVAGVAALMLSLSPSMTPQQVRTVLHGTAVDRGPAGYDLEYGHGRLNAAAAVAGSVDATIDADQDGCLGAQELGPDEVAGGRRDPHSFWDFFDTPDETNTRDKVIAGTDFFRLIGRFGSTGSTSIDPLSQPAAPPAYHTAFDRGLSAGPDLWDLNPPDGAVSGTDLFAIISQFTHSCLA